MMRTHYAHDVTPQLNGQNVTLAGWVHEIRELGNLVFILLRDRTGIVQLTVKKKEASEGILAALGQLVKETAITATGAVVSPTKAATGREVLPTSIGIVGKVHGLVPFEVTGKVPADLDVRLNHRYIDLRRPWTNAVFKIRSQIQKSFRTRLWDLGFQEITPPCLVGSSTEGGTELFPVIYFEKTAYLAQSPQLYKQCAVQGGIDKSFMITPVFRAEKHNTVYHLNEITQMDVEMGFCNDDDAMTVLADVFTHILKGVHEHCQEDLKTIGATVTVPTSVPRFTYTQAIEKLQAAGEKIEWGEDFSKDQEKKLPGLFGAEVFILNKFPTAIRAFYSQPTAEDPKICTGYDLYYRGLEMASGAQRIHDPELLTQRIREKGMNPENFEGYISAFKYGGIPHAGWSIGSERATMSLCGLNNIREAAMFPRDRTRVTP